LKPYETVSLLSTVAKKEAHPFGCASFWAVAKRGESNQSNAARVSAAGDGLTEPLYK
jgi:hypothetical protein